MTKTKAAPKQSRLTRLGVKSKAVVKKHRKVIKSMVGVAALLTVALSIYGTAKALDAKYSKQVHALRGNGNLRQIGDRLDRNRDRARKIHERMAGPIAHLRAAANAKKRSPIKAGKVSHI